MTGYGEVSAKMSGINALFATRLGPNRIMFQDETYIEFTNSTMKVNGLVYGERNVNFEGVTELTYPAFDLSAKIDFTQEKKSGWFGWG
jgi:hypothetical protein